MEEMSLEEYLEQYGNGQVKVKRRKKKVKLPKATTDEPVVCRRILMAPFGKARPRVTRGGKHTHMPTRYVAASKKLEQEFGPTPRGLVHLSVTAVRPMPTRWSGKKREAMNGRYAKPKPDADNIVGAVMDALFDDDDRVVSIFCEKVWGEAAALEIEVAQAGKRP